MVCFGPAGDKRWLLKRISGGSTISADTGFVFILSRKSICKATLWFPQVGVGGTHKKTQNKTGQMRHCSRGSLAAREQKPGTEAGSEPERQHRNCHLCDSLSTLYARSLGGSNRTHTPQKNKTKQPPPPFAFRLLLCIQAASTLLHLLDLRESHPLRFMQPHKWFIWNVISLTCYNIEIKEAFFSFFSLRKTTNTYATKLLVTIFFPLQIALVRAETVHSEPCEIFTAESLVSRWTEDFNYPVAWGTVT